MLVNLLDRVFESGYDCFVRLLHVDLFANKLAQVVHMVVVALNCGLLVYDELFCMLSKHASPREELLLLFRVDSFDCLLRSYDCDVKSVLNEFLLFRICDV